jgi:hypothetical protein
MGAGWCCGAAQAGLFPSTVWLGLFVLVTAAYAATALRMVVGALLPLPG